jgi:hypothetical protein
MSETLFTACQIARALGKTPRAVRLSLHERGPSGIRMVGGNAAAAWSYASLPEGIRARLDREATARNYRTTEDLLSVPWQTWKPKLPLSDIRQEDIDCATKLRAALVPVLQGLHDTESAAAFEARGLAEYARVFGTHVSARYFRKLIGRTLDRDAGAEDWNRLEIYLPERPKPKSAPQIEVAMCLAQDFADMLDYIAACSNPTRPSQTEREGIWTLAFEQCGRLVAAGATRKQALRRVRECLAIKASFLAPTRDALLKACMRKFAALENEAGDPKAIKDKRANNGAHFALPDEDRDLLIHRSVFYNGGHVAPAWRELLEIGFSEELRARYGGKAQDKSHVPTSVMDSIGPEVEIMSVMHRGARAFDSIKGHVDRCYDGIASCQCMSADDFTMPVYFYVPDGKGWYTLTRGQILIFIDFRSLRIIGWSMQADRNYSSLSIRSLCTEVFAEHGLPGVLQFERGIWKSSKLIKGSSALEFTEVSQGLREFGIRFIHSIRPRSKTVERVGGLMQDLMFGEPGYCGRDERKDAPESLRKQMAAVEARAPGCLDCFYSFQQWQERFGKLVEKYNSAAQQGRVLKGLSPDEAFANFADHTNPPMQLGGPVRYLLAHDKRRTVATLNGITLQIGKQKFNYRGKEIAHLVNREVLAWFDPAHSEILTVTDLDRKNPICVKRSNEVSALECIIDPNSTALRTELRRVDDMASRMKARFQAVKSKFPMPQRQLIADANTLSLGKSIEHQRSEIEETERARARQISSIKRRATVPVFNTDRLADADEGTRLMEKAKREVREMDSKQ